MMRKRAVLLGAGVAWMVLGLGASLVSGQTEEPFRVSPEPLKKELTTLDVAAAAEDGSFVVLWDEERGGGQNQGQGNAARPRHLLARRFNSTTCEQSEDIIDRDNCGRFDQAALVSADSRNFSLVCSFKGDLKAPSFNCEGGLQPSNVKVNGKVAEFTVARQPGGGLAVVWIPEPPDPVALRGVLDAEQNPPNGGGFEIAPADKKPAAPRIAVTPGGSLIVTWEADGPEGRDIFAGVFSCPKDMDPSSCSTILPEGASDVQVNLLTTGSQSRPTVAILPSGSGSEQNLPSFLPIWESDLGTSTKSGIFARRFDHGVGGPEFQINSVIKGGQIRPQLAVGSDGNVLAVWEEADGGRISAQLLSRGGFPVGSQRYVDKGEKGALPSRPRVAALPDGRFVVVWQQELSGTFDVMARIVDPRETLPCTPNETTLCLHRGQYQVEVEWESLDDSGKARVEEVSDKLGFFRIFSSTDPELIVAIDQINHEDSNHKVSVVVVVEAVAMPSKTLGLTLTVTDTWTGRTVRYSSSIGEVFLPVHDEESLSQGLQARRL